MSDTMTDAPEVSAEDKGLDEAQEEVKEVGTEKSEQTTESGKKETALTAALKKELKDREELKGIKDVSDLARRYLDVLSHSKSESVPETPEDYELKLSGELAEKAKSLDTEEGRKAFSTVLKELGIPKSKGASVYNLVISSLLSVEEARAKAIDEGRKKAEEELKKELGDKYKDVFTQTVQTLKKVADDDFVKFLDESGVGNDPRFIKALYKLMTMPTEDRLATGGTTSTKPRGVFVFTNTPGMNTA